MKIELTFTADARYKCDGLPGSISLLEGLTGVRGCQACPRFTYCPLSHVAAVATEISDLTALRAACNELGLQFMEGQTTYAWFGQWVGDYHGEDAAYKQGIDPSEYGKCSHAIKVPGSTYEIGVKKLANGNHTLIYDFYGPGRKIMEKLGKGCEKLVQHYGLNKAQMIARAKGLITQRKPLLNGDIKLVVTGV